MTTFHTNEEYVLPQGAVSEIQLAFIDDTVKLFYSNFANTLGRVYHKLMMREQKAG